ncbi:MAG: phosphoglycerate kinase [Verrucomicrobiota bacterium]
MAKITVKDLELKGKRVLVRVDFNVPLDEASDGTLTITDDTRIRAAVPTIEHLTSAGAKVILCSHLGRPKGQRVASMSLAPCADKLASVLGHPVAFVDDCVGEKVEEAVGKLQSGDILLLENTRYSPEETDNDPGFSAKLAALADVYVNDAFGSAHRAHASTEGVARLVEEKALGFLMEKELKFLGEELESPGRPFVFIIGGAKVSDKIKVIDAMLDKADTILIGGAMAYTFALAQGKPVGKSLSEPDKVGLAEAALAKAKEKGVKLLLPTDNLIVEEVDFKAKTTSEGKFTDPGGGIPDGWEGVDIGPETTATYVAEVAGAKTILWNGPMGIFEIESCSKGTFAIAEAIAANDGAVSIIGGGDSVKAVKRSGYSDKVTFMSTGGGASLEFIEGKTLPGVAVIPDA